MAKLALYQKYRSSTFDEVVGQEYTVRSILNAIKENKIGHAYLFCGPRGTGKTTMARLLAKAVNCTNPEKAPCGECENCIAANNGTHPDIIEINAANETHVEDIRDLIDRAKLAPMMGKHKVYIIDEVHQLSSAASSALLKTLEEPPENVIFILATTDPQKLLSTIISRCQRFDFTRIRSDQIRDHLIDIAKKENIEMEPEAAEMIALLADGGMRDSLSIMDQCASFTNDKITVEEINRIYGLATVAEKVDLLKDIFSSNLENILMRTSTYQEKGIDLSRFVDSVVDILKESVVYSSTKKQELLKSVTLEQYQSLVELKDPAEYMSIAEIFLNCKDRFKFATSSVSLFEVTCLKLATEQKAVEVSSIPVIKKKEETKKIEPVSNQVEDTAIEEPKKEIVVSKQEVPSYSIDDYVSILLQCDKVSKASDEAAFQNLDLMIDAEAMKYVSILKDSKIAASGKDCILLSVKAGSLEKRINEIDFNRELYFFSKDKLGVDKMYFAATEQEVKEAIASFVEMRQNESLPAARKIVRYMSAENVESTEEKIKKLFGAENVTVI